VELGIWLPCLVVAHRVPFLHKGGAQVAPHGLAGPLSTVEPKWQRSTRFWSTTTSEDRRRTLVPRNGGFDVLQEAGR
jgi:hypothetical protein